MGKREAKWRKVIRAENRNLPASVRVLAEEYIEEFPEDWFAWGFLGRALTDLDRYDEARRALRRAMRLAPKKSQYLQLRAMGHLYMAKGSLHVAERWYRRAVRAKPSTWGWIFVGDCLRQQGRLSPAKVCFRRAVKRNEDCTDEAYFNLALIARTEGEYREAKRWAELVLKIDPKYGAAKAVLEDIRLLLATRAV